jgi:hypothetical protein
VWKFSLSTGTRSRTVQAVASYYTNYATPALNNNNNKNSKINNFLTKAGQPLVDQGLLIVEVSQSN